MQHAAYEISWGQWIGASLLSAVGAMACIFGLCMALYATCNFAVCVEQMRIYYTRKNRKHWPQGTSPGVASKNIGNGDTTRTNTTPNPDRNVK